MEMASRFADVFDLNMGLVVWDKVGAKSPMDPNYSTVYCVFDDDELDFKNPKYTFKTIERDPSTIRVNEDEEASE